MLIIVNFNCDSENQFRVIQIYGLLYDRFCFPFKLTVNSKDANCFNHRTALYSFKQHDIVSPKNSSFVGMTDLEVIVSFLRLQKYLQRLFGFIIQLPTANSQLPKTLTFAAIATHTMFLSKHIIHRFSFAELSLPVNFYIPD